MAAAQGIITFERPNKSKFSYSIYLDDTAGNPVRFLKDGKAAAGSPDNLVSTELCAIVDIILEGATAKTTTVVKINDLPVSTLLNALFLASVTTRPSPDIVLWPGRKLTMVQVA